MHGSTRNHLFLLLSLVGAGCNKSPGPPAPSPSAPPGPVRDATVGPRKGIDGMLKAPARRVNDPERIHFLVFGDSRAGHSRCDPPRKHRKYCRVQYTPTASGAAEDCALVSKAPALLMGEVAARLHPSPSTPGKIRAQFCLFTGDLVYRGSCARDWEWARQVFLAKVPPSSVFPILGNHDSWQKRGESPAFLLFHRAFPQLKLASPGPSALPHYYAFRIGRSLFVNLCTGGYPSPGTPADFERADRTWLCERAPFATQMRWMDQVLAHGVTQGVKHVFVQYHKPSFSCSRHPPLNIEQDPLTRLRPFKKRHPNVNVVALSGHNHTTSVYLSGGVLVLVVGGGGAPQHFLHGPKACHKDKPDQPPELFWKGGVRTARYNFFDFRVSGDKLSIQEHCLTRRGNKLTVQTGSRISASGRITHTPGACNLSPPP